jgi:hypothetical protein
MKTPKPGGSLPLPAPNRARVTNSPHKLRGIDGRSSQARRFRDLVAALTADAGGELDTGQAAQVRQAAMFLSQIEAMQESMTRSEAIDVELLVRLQNASARALKALPRAPAKAAPKGTALKTYLAAKAAQK